MNKRFQAVLSAQATQVPPIWMMRQAGRYHRHYQALRAEHGFMELCKEPSLAAQVALGPIEDFDFDVSILFSDLLFPLEAMGMGLEYSPAPKLAWQLNSENLSRLQEPDAAIGALEFQKAAMLETRKLLPQDKSLIGFVGGPWTLYCYAVHGGHAGSLVEAKSQPQLYKAFCEKLLPLLKKNIELQIAGGAEIVMVFDTAAGELSPYHFQKWCVPELREMARSFAGKLAYYSKGTQRSFLEDDCFAQDFAGIGVDHRNDVPSLLKENRFGFVQGNFDQGLLFLSPQEFQRELDFYLEGFKDLCLKTRSRWICGLGHGVLPETPEENVREFVKRVRAFFGA